MATVYANVTIQDLKFTEKRLGLNVKISYITDRVGAGASIVTRDEGEHAIDVHIDPAATTATALKAAVDADVVASSWVSVEVTGTGSNLQTSAVRSVLAGGATIKTATKQLGPILFTAKTAGTAGNNVRVKYVNAGSISVSVSTNDITVNFVNNSSTAHAVAAAVNASSPASALVNAHALGSYPMLVAHAAAFTALAGGAAAVAPSAVIQDLTFASDTLNSSDNGATITYTDTATAGSEAVAVSGNAVSIEIESGVTTATQIKTACDASEDFNGAQASGTATVVGYAALKPVAEVKATGSITYGVPVADDTVVVNGSTFTYVAAAPGADEFSSISELEALVEAVTGINSSQNGTVVSITSTLAGVLGNAQTLALGGSNAGTMAVSGAHLTGGADAIAGKSITVAGHALVADTDFNAETSNTVTATNIATAVDALSEVTATAEDEVVTIVAANEGIAGNAITLATTGGANLTLSGAALAGGLNGLECTVSGTGSTAQVTVNAVPTTGASAPSGTAFYMTQAERAITSSFYEFKFGFIPSRLRIRNNETSGTDALVLSYDGVTTAITLLPTEDLLIDIGNVIPHAIWIKYTGGAPDYSIEASAIGPNLSDPTEAEGD